MRTAPTEVVKVLKAYDPRVAIEWDDRRHAWYLVYDGKRQPFALTHSDGTFMIDLYVGEIETLLRRTDNYLHLDGNLRRLEQSVRDRASRREAVRQERLEAMRREAEQVARVWKNGPRPRVGPAFV